MSLADKINFAVMFPGQGSQYVGMGKKLYDNYLTAKEVFSLADDTLNFSLSELCFNGDIKELTKTYNTQPALLTVSYIMYHIYIKERNLNPSVLLGHSLGELTALVCSNAINFEDGLRIARDRGLYMQECGDKNKGSMLAVMSGDYKYIEQLCSDISTSKAIVEISNYNSDSQVVVSGSIEALNTLKEMLKERNIKSIMLNVSAPFHSSIMKTASIKLYSRLNEYNYNPISIPIISNVSGEFYSGSNDIVKNLSMQIIKPVKWIQSIKKSQEQGIDIFVEVGPKSVLKNLNKNICKDLKTLSLDVNEDLYKFRCI